MDTHVHDSEGDDAVSKDLIETAELLSKLDRSKRLMMECRSVFPTIGQNSIGRTSFNTAPFYRVHGYNARVELSTPITDEFIERNRQLGKWINENTLIRLYGILYHHGFFAKLDKTLIGCREMDFLRRMRHAFTKTPLNYRPDDKKNVRLRKEILEYFNRPEEDFPEGEIPAPIDTVVLPIFEGCRRYVTAHTAHTPKHN